MNDVRSSAAERDELLAGATLTVTVDAPAIRGDTVHFRWQQSEPNPYQRNNEFFFRYEGLELAVLSPHLLTEVFLALQLKVFAAYGGPVEVTFAGQTSAPSIAYWRAFHDA